MRSKLHCTVAAQVALCQVCQLGSDYSSQLQGTSDPQWSLSLRKWAMGGEDQSIECQLKPANNSLTCCDVTLKEPCEETLKPFHLILWWSYVGAFFENRIYREHEKYIFKPNSSWFCAKITQLFAHFFGNLTTFVTLLQIPKSFQITLRAQKSESWAWVRQPRRSKLGFWKAQLGPSWLPHSGSALGPSFRPQAARPSCGPCCSSHLHRKVCQGEE